MYNQTMVEHAEDIRNLLEEFSDFSLAELVLEIKELRDNLEQEKKSHAADEFARTKAEEKIAVLEGRIKAAATILNGEADVCIDCAAVNEMKDSNDVDTE